MPPEIDRVPMPAPIDLVCRGPEHIAIGRSRPDGSGHLTLEDGKWGYCSAGIPNAEHKWTPTGGVAIEDLRHAELQEQAPP